MFRWRLADVRPRCKPLRKAWAVMTSALGATTIMVGRLEASLVECREERTDIGSETKAAMKQMRALDREIAVCYPHFAMGRFVASASSPSVEVPRSRSRTIT